MNSDTLPNGAGKRNAKVAGSVKAKVAGIGKKTNGEAKFEVQESGGEIWVARKVKANVAQKPNRKVVKPKANVNQSKIKKSKKLPKVLFVIETGYAVGEDDIMVGEDDIMLEKSASKRKGHGLVEQCRHVKKQPTRTGHNEVDLLRDWSDLNCFRTQRFPPYTP